MSLLLRTKNALRDRLSPERRQALRRHLAPLLAPWFARDLRSLAVLFGSDKWGHHWYAQHYATHFKRLRHKRVNVLEIGVGGYADPRAGGASLRMWKHYFHRGRVFGIDLHDKSALEEPRIRIFRGSQDDPDFLRHVAEQIGRIDIVIDDGSHRNEHVLASFQVLFPLLALDGIYCVEDVQTSYWPELGGDSVNLDSTKTSMGFLKTLADGLNHEELQRDDHAPTYTDRHVVGLHFYHNLVVVQKGVNDEGSNVIGR